MAQFDFATAANAYQNGDYPTAIATYESAVAAGIREGELFFNLATAYYASGDNARALLNYLRTAEYMPRDNETQLQIARLRARREDSNVFETDFMVLLGTLTNTGLTMSELNFLAWAAWVIFFTLLIVFMVGKQWRQKIRLVMFVSAGSCLFLLILLGSRHTIHDSRPAAVITQSAVQVMNGAGENYLPLFRIFNAAEVRILQEQANWMHILLPDGRQGWLPSSALEKVSLP